MSSDIRPERGDDAIRVLIVDDHAVFRRGLRDALASQPGIEVVGEAGDGGEAVGAAATLAPDVVLMDVRMPSMSGIDAARAIHGAQPNVKIVMLTMSEDPDDLFSAVHAGAHAYLLKEASAEEIAGAVRAVHRGHGVVSPPMTAKLLAEFAVLARRADGRDGAPGLTARELEVLRLVAKGLSNKEIASELVIAQNTVKNHVRHILEKLHLRSRVEAAMYAARERLVDAG